MLRFRLPTRHIAAALFRLPGTSAPDKRQVLPVVASTPDGVEQRTIVIAVERNTKVLEPMVRETND